MSSLLAEKATMQESALERIMALEAANLELRNTSSAGETALQNELTAMTARYEVSQGFPCMPPSKNLFSLIGLPECVVLGFMCVGQREGGELRVRCAREVCA